MAEVVGLVASIIQIAGMGAKLSTALYHLHYFRRTRRSGH
jgi:hypothetical protein